MLHPQGISSEDFLRTGLGYQVIEDSTGGKRAVSVGAQHVRWGIQVAEAWSDLDATADYHQCFKN